MLPRQITKTMSAASSAVIASVQPVASAGNLTLQTTANPLDTQRRVFVTLTASNSGVIFTFSGTNESGVPIRENVTIGATATTAQTLLDYKGITNIAVSATLSGSVSVGTSATGSIPWQAANPWIAPYNLSIGVNLAAAGTALFTYTLDPDPCGVNLPYGTTYAAPQEYTPGTAVIAQSSFTSGAAAALFTGPCSAWRLTTTTGTGALTVNAIEAGV